MWARTSLTQRVMALVVFGLLLLLAAFAFISTWALRESVQRSLQERLLLAQVAAQSIDHYNRSLLAQIQEVASSNSIDLVHRDLEQEHRVLESLKSKLSARELFLLDRGGTVLAIQPQANDAIGVNLSDNRYVASAYFAGQPRISQIAASFIGGNPVVVYLVPILGADGKVVGAIGAGIDLTQPKISGFIEAITLGRTGYAQVVDEKGEVLASTQPQDVFGQSDHGARFVALIQDKKAVVRTCHNCHESAAGVSRRKDVLAFAPLSTASWGVAVRQAEEEALRPSQTLKLGMLGVGIGSLLLVLALTAVFMRGLLSPIRRLTDAARRIAAGDLSGPIEAKGEDEIAVLARSFETMRAELEISRQQIEDRAKDIEQRNLELSALNAIATTTSQSLDLEQSLDAALDKVLAAIGSEAGGIFLAGAEGQPMVLKIQRGLSQNHVEFIARWQQPATLPQDVLPITQEAGPPSARNGRPVSITSVPLSSKGRLQGLLVLVTKEGGLLGHRERELLAAIGHQIAVAVDNANLFREEQRREQEAEALYELGVEISALMDVDKILDSVVGKARELLGADVGILNLLDESTETIHIRATSGVRVQAFNEMMLNLHQGFAGKVVELGRVVTVLDYMDDPTISHDDQMDSLVEQEGLKSHAGAPLKIADKVIGALTVAYRSLHAFQRQETDLLSRLANQAALAIENARLYEEVRHKEQLRGQLLERLISAQEDERRRLARELHDDTAQALSGLIMQFESIERELPPELAEIKARLARHRITTVRALEDIRRLIADLRPTVLDDLGLLPAIRWYAADRLESQGVEVAVESPKANPRLPAQLETALFRIVQEAINNIAKHAQCSTARIALQVQDSLVRVIIADNGKSFRAAQVLRPRHKEAGVGLLGMQERVALFGGTLNIDSSPGQGTKITIEIPLSVARPALPQ